MTSWGGTSMVTVLRSILTMLSMKGSRIKSPGPFGPPCTRPRRKITPRSYSLTILMALSTTDTANTAIATRAMNPIPTPTACNKPKFAYIRNSPLVLILRVHYPAIVGPLRVHHLHRASLAEAHHGHLAPHPYHRLTVPRIGPFGSERQHGPPQAPAPPPPPTGPPARGSAPAGANANTARHSSPCTNTQPVDSAPTGLLTVPTSPIIPSLPVRARLPLRARAAPNTPTTQ